MHFIYHVLLVIIYFVTFVHCQGGRGGGGGGGRVGLGGGRTSCTTENCKEAERMNRLYWILGPSLLTLLCGTIKFCCMYHRVASLPKHSTFISVPNRQDSKEEIDNVNPFQSGLWSSRYFQYEKWHGPHQFPLTFDPQSMKVTGSGSDDVGSFTIDGIYSIETRRIGLTKQYQLGTGDPSENFGHQVTIQLTWNTQNRQLEGKYYAATTKYDEGEFELKFYGAPSSV